MDRLSDRPGATPTTNSDPTAAASFSRVSWAGRVPPPSLLAMADWVAPIRDASSLWLRPASVRSRKANQDILENTLAGILMLFRQPFRSGDQITVMEQAGTVEAITIRETRLATFDGELVLIPNRDVYKNVIRVHTYHPHHRVEFTVGIAYESDPQDAATTIVEALATVAEVQDHPAPTAAVSDLGVSSVEMSVMFWTSAHRAETLATTDAAIRAVKRHLDDARIEMPADIVVLQAAPSFGVALHGGGDLTPAGSVVRSEPERSAPDPG